ncbi:uncharacterized protein B0I36DRAFT_389433 [Microdochium trichocladiopsis]|uniref:Rhodopsin domain-containing protein n=1 Tax=Microdochium trichocladiopsis TaxID=1682393 RepID=A0A9P8XVM7_9PEZI|nr:uncharacterized protein B0I36DRAFT_389433 [Microdochium trichocladiopsis]KAH7014578.1 hypothetical protein B0I36DRAFT_389433 [Microdochium trichocladiopsis]
MSTVFDFVGVTNLHEPKPWSNEKSTLIGLPVACLVTAWVCVLSRLYTRFFVIRSPWWDDLCIFLHTLLSTAATIAVIRATGTGLGQHFLLLKPDEMKGFLMNFYIISGAYTTSTALVKLALLLQYLRMFDRGTPIYRFTICVTVFTALWGLAYSLMSWIPCTTPSKYWSLQLDDTCYGFSSMHVPELVATYESHTGINMSLDFLLLFIPLRLFWKSGTTRIQRLRLLGIFSLGGICIIFAAWRLAVIIQTEVATKPVFDPTWYSGIGILLALMEVDCAAVCASVPIFWPQLSKHIGNIMVIREVRVTSESRDNPRNPPQRVDDDDDDGSAFAAGLSGARGDERDGSVYRLRQESSSTVEMDEIEVMMNKRKQHYQDQYVMDRVDPLRSVGSKTITTVEHIGK